MSWGKSDVCGGVVLEVLGVSSLVTDMNSAFWGVGSAPSMCFPDFFTPKTCALGVLVLLGVLVVGTVSLLSSSSS